RWGGLLLGSTAYQVPALAGAGVARAVVSFLARSDPETPPALVTLVALKSGQHTDQRRGSDQAAPRPLHLFVTRPSTACFAGRSREVRHWLLACLPRTPSPVR